MRRGGAGRRATARGSSTRASAGVTVNATPRDASVASTYARASGRKSAPSRPPSRKTGRNTSATIIVA